MERPILFSTHMVRAIIKLIKKMTRRVIKISFLPGYNPEWTGYKPVFEYGEFFLAGSNGEPATKPVKCPYGKPGDILWVRETWQSYKVKKPNRAVTDDFKPIQYLYKADGGVENSNGTVFKWRPSIFMPKEACRIKLRITGIRVERLQDITEDDAMAEGVSDPYDYQEPEYYEQQHMRGIEINKSAFAGLWDSLNVKRGYGWDTNPWVWVIEFEKLAANKSSE